MKHGKGKFFFADGKVYEGEFVAGKKQGFGTFINQLDLSQRQSLQWRVLE
jgi:hypothetical protein